MQRQEEEHVSDVERCEMRRTVSAHSGLLSVLRVWMKIAHIWQTTRQHYVERITPHTARYYIKTAASGLDHMSIEPMAAVFSRSCIVSAGPPARRSPAATDAWCASICRLRSAARASSLSVAACAFR